MSQLTSTLINQSSSQIDKTYKSEWESFLSNLQHVEMGLYHGIMSFELYLEMQTWIKQRDEQQRVDKGKTNHMNELKDVHLVIALGILTQDDVDKDGNEYDEDYYYDEDDNYCDRSGLIEKEREI